jgi:hypothetical protein
MKGPTADNRNIVILFPEHLSSLVFYAMPLQFCTQGLMALVS